MSQTERKNSWVKLHRRHTCVIKAKHANNGFKIVEVYLQNLFAQMLEDS